jgi:agmatinase
MPAVNYPVPGGFSYLQLNELLGGLAKKAKIVGLNMVELAPAQDVNNLSAITAANIIWNVIGMVVRSPYFKKASPTK